LRGTDSPMCVSVRRVQASLEDPYNLRAVWYLGDPVGLAW